MQLDLKPQELFKYTGTNPCPADIHEFWDEAVREMEAIDPQVSLTPVMEWLENVEAFDLYYTGVGGERIYAKYLRPTNAQKAPVIFTYHGYSGKTDDWMGYLYLVSQGFCVAAMDCRGQAGKSEDGGGVKGNTYNGHIIRGLQDDSPKDLLFTKIFLDAAELVRIVEKFDEVDENRLYAMGGSQGGGLTIACCALSPQIKKAASCYPFLSDYKRVWEMDMDERAYLELKQYFRYYDPRHEKIDETFLRLGYIDVHNLASRIKAEFKMFTGLMDNVCPPSTQFAAYNQITSKKEVFFYPDFGHEYLPEWNSIVLKWFMDK